MNGHVISPVIASSNTDESNVLKMFSYVPHIYRRSVGDAFAIPESQRKEYFFRYLNSQGDPSSFEMEPEDNERTINLLNCLLKVSETQNFTVSIHIKPTSPGRQKISLTSHTKH